MFRAEEMMVDTDPRKPHDNSSLIFCPDMMLTTQAGAQRIIRILRLAGLDPGRAFDIPKMAAERGGGQDALDSVWKDLGAFFTNPRYVRVPKILLFCCEHAQMTPDRDYIQLAVDAGHRFPGGLDIGPSARHILVVRNAPKGKFTVEGVPVYTKVHGSLYLVLAAEDDAWSEAQRLPQEQKMGLGLRAHLAPVVSSRPASIPPAPVPVASRPSSLTPRSFPTVPSIPVPKNIHTERPPPRQHSPVPRPDGRYRSGEAIPQPPVSTPDFAAVPSSTVSSHPPPDKSGAQPAPGIITVREEVVGVTHPSREKKEEGT